MTALVNLTPHEVVVLGGQGDARLRLPSTGLARMTTRVTPFGQLDGEAGPVPLVDVWLGEVTGLPVPRSGVRYIVSWPTYEALPQRLDLLVPADDVRDATGRIIGCRALGRIHRSAS